MAKADMHDIGYADGASTSKDKGTNYFVKNPVVTDPAVHVANKARKKKKKQNVSRLERIPTFHHCGIKGHIRPLVISCKVHQNKSNGRSRRKSHR